MRHIHIMKKTNAGVLSQAAAPLVAFLANICCWGPVVLVGLGIGGAAFAVKVAAYRPYLLLWAIGMVMFSLYWAYFRTKPREGERPCCHGPRIRRKKIAALLSAAAVLVMALYPYGKGPVKGRVPDTAQAKVRQIVFRVDGMSCERCAARLEDGLKTIPGISSASVSFEEGRATVILADTARAAAAMSTTFEQVRQMGFRVSGEEDRVKGRPAHARRVSS